MKLRHLSVRYQNLPRDGQELNLVSWNGRKAKYDIREWSPDHEKLGKGVTLSEEELRALGKLIDQEIKRLDRGVSDAVDYDEL